MRTALAAIPGNPIFSVLENYAAGAGGKVK